MSMFVVRRSLNDIAVFFVYIFVRIMLYRELDSNPEGGGCTRMDMMEGRSNIELFYMNCINSSLSVQRNRRECESTMVRLSKENHSA